MSLKSITAGLVLAALLAGGPATAAAIVDTGSPAEVGGGWSLMPTQWLAGEFTVSGDTTLTSIEAYMGGFTAGSQVVFRVYSDNIATNAPGSVLFSKIVSVGPSTGAWWAADSLGWQLGAGVYWAAFETLDSGFMNRFVANPIHEARSAGGAYFDSAPLSIGVRVFGDAGFMSGVPEPGTWIMMVAGFGALGLGLRRRRSELARAMG